MHHRRIRFKCRKRRHKQRGRGCKAAANCWQPPKQMKKTSKKFLLKLEKTKVKLLKTKGC